MTCGSIAAIDKQADKIVIQIVDEGQNNCTFAIARTNYRLAEGDYISWTDRFAYWRSQASPEKEIKLFLPPKNETSID